MKIAVTYEDGKVFQHFGHSEKFKVYETEDGKVVSSEVADTNGSGHGALADFLAEKAVKVLICGGSDKVRDRRLHRRESNCIPVSVATQIRRFWHI